MNWFDRDILTWLNHFAHASYLVDVTIVSICISNAVKGALATVVLLWFWFGEDEDRRRHREIIVATAGAAIVAIVLGRILATVLPFRVRPVHNSDLGFVAPYGYPDNLLRGWSAFPSDHAMLFGAIATGLWFISRRLGAVAFVYTVLVILVPRLYLGLHHPTDIIVGLGLGILVAAGANVAMVRRRMARLPLRWLDVHPRSFYAAAFIAAMQVATMLEGPREAAHDMLVFLRSRSASSQAHRSETATARDAQVELRAASPEFPGAAALEPAVPVRMPLPLRVGETALR